MADRPNPVERVQPPKEGTHPRGFSPLRAKREDAPSFIAEPLRDSGRLADGYDLTSATDGRIYLRDNTSPSRLERELDPKSISEHLKKESMVQYEQIKYDMMKHALPEALKSDVEHIEVKHIKEVQKVEDGYTYKYDLGNGEGVKEGKLSLGDEKHSQSIQTFEKHMADYGFAIEQPMPESIKKAVLKHAAETAATPEEKKLLENGAVQSYDVENKKWYISKNGKIEDFSLDNQKIEEDAELNGVKKYLKLKNEKNVEENIVDAKFKEGDKDQYEVKRADHDNWETIAKKDVNPDIIKKIMGEKMINPDSHVTVVESKETSEEAKLRQANKLIDELKDERESLERWGKSRKKMLNIAMFANQGAAQASQNLDAVAQALQLGGGNNGMQPTTVLSSDRVFKAIDEKHRNKVKEIEQRIGHIEKHKVNVEKHKVNIEKTKNKLAEENEKYKKIIENIIRQQGGDKPNPERERRDKPNPERERRDD